MRTNRNMAIVAAVVVSALILGANVGQFRTLEHTLGAQAEQDARGWIEDLSSSMPDIRGLIATGSASSRQMMALGRELGEKGKLAITFYAADGGVIVSAGSRPWSDRDDWSSRVQTAVADTARTGVPQQAVFSASWLDQEHELIGSAFAPILDEDGQVEGVIGAFIDRSESARSFSEAFARLSVVLSVVFTVALTLLAAAYFLVRRQADSSRQQASYLAHFDPLTGLYNRGGFRDRLKTLTRQGTLNCDKTAVIYIDLDGFKHINDTYGHGAGDSVLRHVGNAISDCLGPNDIGVRFGGDEFVVICAADTTEGAISKTERIRMAIAQPVSTNSAVINAHASCGLCMGAQCGADIDQALHHADLALYQAKLDGRNTYRVFTPELEEMVKRRVKIEDSVRQGLQNNQFALHYQPLISQRTRQCIGFEALLRLNDSEGKPISPGEFVPVAEASGLIQQIGEWVIETAAAEAARWPEHLHVAVNLSARQFDKANLVSIVSGVLARTGLAPNRLELEVTESLLIENAESVGRQLSALRAVGVSIAMDDFGTGYSSLGYLWRYGFDKLKIDRTFVIGLDTDAARSKEIIDTIVVLAHRLDMTVTVEGIETETQAAAIADLDCDQLQGYLFGRPMPAEDLAGFLLSNAAKAGSATEQTEHTHHAVKAG